MRYEVVCVSLLIWCAETSTLSIGKQWVCLQKIRVSQVTLKSGKRAAVLDARVYSVPKPYGRWNKWVPERDSPRQRYSGGSRGGGGSGGS